MAEPNVTIRAAGKYLGFRLGDEEYGLPILSVQEIIGLQPITRVPRVPAFVRGVINLRGKIVPVLDLRLKFGMQEGTQQEVCIVVVRSRGVDSGILVDSVSEVLAVAADDIAPTPVFGAVVDTACVKAISKAGGRVRFLLDADAVLSDVQVKSNSESPAPIQR